MKCADWLNLSSHYDSDGSTQDLKCVSQEHCAKYLDIDDGTDLSGKYKITCVGGTGWECKNDTSCDSSLNQTCAV